MPGLVRLAVAPILLGSVCPRPSYFIALHTIRLLLLRKTKHRLFIELSQAIAYRFQPELSERIGAKRRRIVVALMIEDVRGAEVWVDIAPLCNAEAALKKAKARGDRYLFYTPTMTETVARTLTLENQLRQALDNEEFVLHYQPKVNLVSGKLTGAEALIRWNDPRTGLVPPGRFIPVLEETGLIHEVGRWALRKAIQDYLRWRAAGLPAVRIAVNVSPLQLRHRDFIAEIGRAVGIDPQAAGDFYSNHVNRAIFDPPYRYDYLARPYRIVPNTAAAMPENTDAADMTALTEYRQGKVDDAINMVRAGLLCHDS
jgi:hypothetical protein